MAWVTAIGPSDEQVEYRLTGRHGCATSNAALIEAAPAVAAVRAAAQARGVEPAAFFTTDRQRQMWARISTKADLRDHYVIKASTAERLLRAAGVDPQQVYGESLSEAAAAEADPQVAYRMDANERPLVWIGSGLREFDITPGSELTPEQWDMARAIMRGADPRTGEQLVEPKIAVDPRGKLAARPLVDAIDKLAAERGIKPEALFNSARKRDAYGRMSRQVTNLGDAHRVKITDVGKLADAVGIDTIALYGREAVETALAFENDRVVVGNRGYDYTANMPKAFSVAVAFAEGDFARELEQVFVDALTESVTEAERWVAYGMRGRHGDDQAAERVSSTGLMGWVNFHRTARPVGDAPFGDPHFHGHVTLANMGRGEDGKWSTIAAGGRDLYRHAKVIDALTQTRVRAVTHERWGLEWERNTETGVWQIVGIPGETIDLFSKRRNAVRELFEALGIPYTEATTAQQKAAARKVAHAKDEEATTAPDEVLRAYWRAEAEAAEQDPDAILAAVLNPPMAPPPPEEQVTPPRSAADIDGIARWVFRTDEGLTSHRKDFTRAEALAAVTDAPAVGLLNADQAEDLTDRVLSHRGYTIRLSEKLPQHLSNTQRYTTADIVAAERLILHEARSRFGTGTATVSEQTFAMAVATYEAIQRTDNPSFELAQEQLDVLRRILLDGHGVDAVVGVAGAGKTTIMDVARMAWEAEGRIIQGASTAAVAAANLRMEAGIHSGTVAKVLTKLDQGQEPLRGVDVLVVDEAAMVDDRQMARLLDHAGETGTKVVGIGDWLQLQSPGVGGSFKAVHEVVGGLSLTTNYRQRDAIERRALELWRNSERREALRLWADSGQVHAATTREEAMSAMLAAWQDRRESYEDVHQQITNVLLLAPQTADVHELNTAARAVRRECGEIGEQDTEYRLKGGGSIAFAAGDIVLLRKNDYRAWQNSESADVLNGYRGVVATIDENNRLLIEWSEKTPDGDRRTIREWVSADYVAAGGLSHGIAMTVHKAQGLSADHALVYGVGLAANGAYTALSRDRLRVDLFLPREVFEDEETRARLGDPSTSAEEIDRALSAFAASLDANDGLEPLIITELGEKLEPLIPTASPETSRTDEEIEAQEENTEHLGRYAETVREALHGTGEADPDRLTVSPAWDTLAEALAEAEDAGYDPAALLAEVTAERALDDAESLPAVLAWRVRQHIDTPDDVLHADAAAEASEDEERTYEPQAEKSTAQAPTWRDREFGHLSDAELMSALADATAQARQAAIAAARATAQVERQAGQLQSGPGRAEQSLMERYEELKERAEAIEELQEAETEVETTGAEVIAIQSELAALESTGGRRGRQQRAEAAAALRTQLEDAQRRLVELDIKRDRLKRGAGPERTRETAVREYHELTANLPERLKRARRSDAEDAADAAHAAAGMRQHAEQLAARRGGLVAEQEHRGSIGESAAATEESERSAERVSVAEENATEQARAYDEDMAQQWNQDRDQGRGWRL